MAEVTEPMAEVTEPVAEVTEPAAKIRRIQNVTDLFKKKMNPNVRSHLDNLVKHCNIETKTVHESFNYETYVGEMKAWSCIGIFYDYLIKKEINNLLKEDSQDHSAIKLIEQIDSGIIEVEPRDSYQLTDEELEKLLNKDQDDDEELKYQKQLLESYKQYKNKENETLNILEDIYNTSMIHMYKFGSRLTPFDSRLYNLDNIKTILNHVKGFNLDNVFVSPVLACDYFKCCPDIILDDTIFDIKTSKHASLKSANKTIKKQTFYQLIFYAVAWYLSCCQEVRKFKLYNPLLGYEHTLEIPELDFDEFEELLDKEEL